MKKSIMFLIFLLAAAFIFADKLAVLHEVIAPGHLVVDGNRFYITSTDTTVYVYSTVDFKFIKKFVKNGEGPGEAVNSSVILKNYQDFLTAEDFKRKIMFFSRDGDFIKEIKVPRKLFEISLMGENFLGKSEHIDSEKEIIYYNISLLDKKSDTIKILHKSKELKIFTSGKTQKKKIMRPLSGYFNYEIYNNHIYIADCQKGFSITVFDSEGNQLYEINRKYKKVKVPRTFIDNLMNKLKKTPVWERIKTRYHNVFPEYFPAIKRFWVNNGRIYTLTNEKKEEGKKGKVQRELVVLDLKGKIIKRMFVPDVKGCTIDRNIFYYLFENEDKEVWELHAKEIK